MWAVVLLMACTPEAPPVMSFSTAIGNGSRASLANEAEVVTATAFDPGGSIAWATSATVLSIEPVGPYISLESDGSWRFHGTGGAKALAGKSRIIMVYEWDPEAGGFLGKKGCWIERCPTREELGLWTRAIAPRVGPRFTFKLPEGDGLLEGPWGDRTVVGTGSGEANPDAIAIGSDSPSRTGYLTTLRAWARAAAGAWR